MCRAFARGSAWRPPPHWSTHDWLDELQAIIHAGAVGASLDYEPGRGVPLRAFIYLRAVAAAWNRYRQEWAYYLHFAPEFATATESTPEPADYSIDDRTLAFFLEQALDQLSLEDQWLIRQLFWNSACQRRVAVTLHVSQQEVSKRKARVLRRLRRALSCRSQVFSQFLALCGALLDALDLLPVIDFL